MEHSYVVALAMFPPLSLLRPPPSRKRHDRQTDRHPPPASANEQPPPAPDNVDYDSLKYEIKINTRRDQARAMAIPGHRDPALLRFETGFYEELCAQHDRVDLFVSSKAAEIASRLGALHSGDAQWGGDADWGMGAYTGDAQRGYGSGMRAGSNG